MNKSKIDWCDYTWNIVTGCYHDCPYCYARRIAERFKNRDDEALRSQEISLESKMVCTNKSKDIYPSAFVPTFHERRIDEPRLKTKPSKIFVSSMGDLFGEWVPDEWIEQVFDSCQKSPQHTFMFLTKNPRRYFQMFDKSIGLPINALYGFTVTNLSNTKVISALNIGVKNFVSMEPLLSGPQHEIEFRNIHWVIVGAQTGPGAIAPKKEWVQAIIEQCRNAGIPIFLKDNLKWHEKIQEFPL